MAITEYVCERCEFDVPANQFQFDEFLCDECSIESTLVKKRSKAIKESDSEFEEFDRGYTLKLRDKNSTL